MKPRITVRTPATGWVVENNAAPGSGKMEMSSNARVRVTDATGRYQVGLVRPVKGRRRVSAEYVFDTEQRAQRDATDFTITIR